MNNLRPACDATSERRKEGTRGLEQLDGQAVRWDPTVPEIREPSRSEPLHAVFDVCRTGAMRLEAHQRDPPTGASEPLQVRNHLGATQWLGHTRLRQVERSHYFLHFGCI